MTTPRIQSFQDFWPYYVSEHSKSSTRWLHFCGTTLAVGLLIAAIVMQWWWLLVAVPLAGYGLAWISHFTIEKNRPATFTYPLWSLAGDMKMWWLMLTGRMQGEIRRLKPVADRGQAPRAT
jgi:hypothetical protein